MAHLLQATHLVWWTHVRSVAGEFRRDTKVIEQSISPGQVLPVVLTTRPFQQPSQIRKGAGLWGALWCFPTWGAGGTAISLLWVRKLRPREAEIH